MTERENDMNRIYLLTGAAGLLGSNILRQLIDKGEHVRALVLPNDPAIKHIPKTADVVCGDLLDICSLERFFTVPDDTEKIVIHSGGIVTLTPEPNPKVYAVNVQGTENIIKMCLKHKVKKLVYVSSTGAIPELPYGKKIKEVNHFLPTDNLVGYYSVTKAEASQRVLDAVKDNSGLDASIVHPSGICGPNDYAYGPMAQFIIQYAKGEMKAGIEGTFNSVDVRDLADGVIKCSERGRRGECYIMSNSLVGMKELFDIINDTVGLSFRPPIMSAKTAHIAVKLLAFLSRISGKPSLLNDFAIYNLTRNNDYDCTKAKNELGFVCRPFKETIRDEVNWLKAEGKI